MLSLKDFKKYKVNLDLIIGGNTPIGHTYECNNSDDTFSILGEVNYTYANNRCRGGFTAIVLYDEP